jgi:hypothetical protein
VKFVVFATYWQALAISAFPGMTEEQAFLWNDVSGVTLEYPPDMPPHY